MRICWMVSWMLLSCHIATIVAAAPGPAVTDVREADADFAFQGEYAGSLYESPSGDMQIGLQVIARGDGKFEAVQYRGGLPGSGWDRADKLKLAGQLEQGVLHLDFEGRRIQVGDGRAVVYNTGGNEIGVLNKVQRRSSRMGAMPPPNAMILFDGSLTGNLVDARITEDGLLEVGTLTKTPVQDFRLHLEFRTPYMAHASGQSRGNSGVYIQRRYEVQILDSFGLDGVYNECGALYRQQPPDINMCFPPLSWQTYDIWFTAARFDGAGEKIANARITVLHNGVAVHDNREIKSKTGAGRPETPEPLPILLQDHGNPVNFRNVWIVLGQGVPKPVASCHAVCTTRKPCFPRLRRIFCRIRLRARCR